MASGDLPGVIFTFLVIFVFFRKNQTEIKSITNSEVHSKTFQKTICIADFLQRRIVESGGSMRRKNRIALKLFTAVLAVSFLYPFCSIPLNAEETATAMIAEAASEPEQEEEESMPEPEQTEEEKSMPEPEHEKQESPDETEEESMPETEREDVPETAEETFES